MQVSVRSETLCQEVNAHELWEDPLCLSLLRRCVCTRNEQKTADTWQEMVRRALGVWGEGPLPLPGEAGGVAAASSSGGAMPAAPRAACSASSDAAGRPLAGDAGQ